MRVLIVEDEQRLAETVRRGLASDGFAVDVVHSGTDGLWAATESDYDVIVLDIMLPGLNGYKVDEQMRGRGYARRC
jgi:DNA-binding response OmpR family regulator